MPTLSFIIPVYKVEKYIPSLVDSLINQTYTDWEAILVDDGSPDNSGRLCDEAAEKDSRIKVVHKPNGGVGSARNVGLDTAQGKYVNFVDSDDTLRCDMVEKTVNVAEKNNADIVMFGLLEEYHDENGNVAKSFVRHTALTGVYTGEPYKDHFDALANQHFITLKVIKREFIEKNHIRFNDKKIGEDGVFHADLYKHNPQCIAFVDEPLYIYNAGRLGSASNSYHADRMQDNFYLAGKIESVVDSWGLSDSTMHSKTVSYCYLLDLQLSIKNASLSPLKYSDRVKWLKTTVKDNGLQKHIKAVPISRFGSRNDKIKLTLLKTKQYWAVMLLSGLNNKV